MSCGENHDSLLLAIECVAAAGDNKLTARLTDYLMGEVDEIPKVILFIPLLSLSYYFESNQ